MARSRPLMLQLLLVLVLFSWTSGLARQTKLHRVLAKSDGSFVPMHLAISDGDTVVWEFEDRVSSVVPVDSTGAAGMFGGVWKAYEPADPNEFTGPMPRAVSGIFTLGPDGAGFVIDSLGARNPACNPNSAVARVGNHHLCSNGEPFATMDWTWQNPNLTGVFIRMRWKTVHRGPGDFDWSVMDREIEKAVRNGKMYSLSFKAGSKGTPDWIFDPAIAGADTVKPLVFQDTGDNPEPGECGVVMTLGSPADANYRKHYFDLWRAAAQHIRSRNGWYRALAYVKPSGLNLFSHENRLPNRCESGCNICNLEVWAEQGGYTPSMLYDFYSEQHALLAMEFPEKDISYMLIQAGFPRINNQGEYRQPLTEPLPGGVEQTEQVLVRGRAEHGLRFVVQHNGLGVRPQDRPVPKPACPNEGMHPAMGPFARAGEGCPNRWVLQAGELGQVTGFQTNNAKGVASPAELESALQNAWDNSDGIFVEIYEQRFWEAEVAGPVLDPSRSGQTLADWAVLLHERRRDFWGERIPEPFPPTHRHVFRRTAAPGMEQVLYYVNPARMNAGDTVQYGAIVLEAGTATAVDELENLPPHHGANLHQNYPNPFNPETRISFELQAPGTVYLSVIDVQGNRIRTLLSEHRTEGTHAVSWDGTDDTGERVASGSYIYELKAGGSITRRKMVLVR